MSDLHSEAPQPSRSAPYVRANRTMAKSGTDITVAFDQILANAAQPAPQAKPHAAPTSADVPVDAVPLESGKRVESPQDEESAAPVDAVERHDAPHYDALPVPLEQRNRADRVHDAQHEGSPVAVVSASAVEALPASRTTQAQPPQAKQPRTTDPRRALTPDKTTPHSAAPNQNEIARRVEPVIHEAAKRSAAIRSSETRTEESRPPEPRTNERATAAARKIVPVESTTKTATAAAPATPVRNHLLIREAQQARPVTDAAGNVATKAKNSANPVAASAPATPIAPFSPAPQVANAAPEQLPRRSKSRNESKPLVSETSASADVTATKIARTDSVGTTKNLPNSQTKQVETVHATKPSAAETDSARIGAQAAVAVAVESPPAPRTDPGAKADVRRPRDTRTTAVASAEIRNGEAAMSVASPTNAVAPPPIAPSAPATNAASPILITPSQSAAPSSAESSSAGKVVSATSPRVDRRASMESATPTGASRESGKSLVDTAKASAQPRARNDQQQEVDRVRLVQRVAKAVQTAQDRGAPLRLRLTPPELGVLKIELVVRDGALSARLEAETPAAKTVILENLSALRERLTAQEIKIERFDVDLMQQPDSGGERQSFADAESSREQAAARQFRSERAPTNNAQASVSKPTLVRHATGHLNVLA